MLRFYLCLCWVTTSIFQSSLTSSGFTSKSRVLVTSVYLKTKRSCSIMRVILWSPFWLQTASSQWRTTCGGWWAVSSWIVKSVFISCHCRKFPSLRPWEFLWKTSLTTDCIWQHLQGERRNYNFFKATVKDLFQIFPTKPHFEKPSSDRCRTCAIVGNSVNLRRSHYGPLIDSQDVVIR